MAVTSVQEALNILNGLVSTQKVENEGINDQGKLSSEEWNAVVVVVNSLLKLGGHTNVADAVDSNAALNDQVLYRAAGESEWRIVSVDSIPTENSDNPVASGGVYIRLNAIAQAISDLEEDIAYVAEDDGEGGVPSGGGGTPTDLTDYALKTWVAQNFLGKTSMDTTPTANSTNPVTSGGVKQYVDSHGGGGGGDTNVIETVKVNGTPLIPDANKAVDVPVPKVAVFTSTSTESKGTYTFDFGTTKFSDIQNAIQNNDFVFLINNGVKYVYSLNVFGILEFYTVVAFENISATFVALQQGANDSITGVVYMAEIVNADWNESDTSSLAFIKNKPTIPSALSELSPDTTHQTVTNAEKTKWNAATKGLEKIAEADIDNAITAGIYEVNESAAPGVPYLLMVEMRSSTETIEDPISGEVISSIMHLYYFQTRLRNNVISRRQRVDVGSWSAWEDVTDNTKADKVTSATANNAAALDANGNLKDSGVPAAGIPFGRVDSTSTATAFTATVPGITELRDGMCVLLENGVVTSAAGFTLNINNLGAKPSFNNMTAATRDTTIFNVNYTMLFVYDAMRVVDGITGAWCCYRGYDGNTNTIGYQVRTNSSTLPVSDQTGRYRLLFTSADGSKYVPATTSTSTNATSSRAVNQRPIDPHGAIVYYSSTTVISANGNVGTSSQWQQYTLTLGYSFNRTGAALVLSYPKPVYVKCAPQADGSAIIDADTPYVQALPTTADGKIYIHLGRAYSATAIELTLDHPVYHYYNGAIRRWLGPV